MYNSKHKSITFLSTLFLIVCSLALLSCGGGGDGEANPNPNPDPNGDPGAQTKWGFIEVFEESSGSGSGTEVGLFAVFFQANANIPVNSLKDSIIPTVDNCEVTDIASIDDLIPDISGVTATISTISAGQNILFSNAVGTYAELTKQTITGLTMYGTENDDNIAGSIPDGLLVDIPGDVFPAFSNVPVPNAGELVVTNPALGSSITPDTTFTWVASSDPDTFIEISASSMSVSQTGVTMTIVDCEVLDDGSFAFPQAIKDAMGTDFTMQTSLFGLDIDFITRITFKIIEQNDAILMVTSNKQ